MGKDSAISWTHHTFNPWIGCTKVSPGCKNCYAERDMDKRYGKAEWGPRGTRMVTSDANWKLPLRWNRHATEEGARFRVFCASLADVFEDWKGPMTTGSTGDFAGSAFKVLPDGRFWLPGFLARNPDARDATMQDFRDALFANVEATPALDWMLLTKRPENVMAMVPESWRDGFPRNVWVGTSVENQSAADERIPHLLKIPAAVRFLSCEPLLGPLRLPLAHVRLKTLVHSDLPLDMGKMLVAEPGECFATSNRLGALSVVTPDGPLGIRPDEFERLPNEIHWVIVGGESGPNARPMHPDWARSLRDQCSGAGVAFHFKQWGEWKDGSEGSMERRAVLTNGNSYTMREVAELTVPDADKIAWPKLRAATMAKVGVKKAGRLLDGVTHDRFPEVRA